MIPRPPGSTRTDTLFPYTTFFRSYKVLFVTIEMRHAPFFGWIHDLSAPDPTTIFNLMGLLPWDPSAVPVIGHFLMLGIWPLSMGFTMFVQQRMNTAPRSEERRVGKGCDGTVRSL